MEFARVLLSTHWKTELLKSKFREWTTPIGDPRFPAAPAPFSALKTYRPSEPELELNPRARSAHLRAVKKICD